MRWLTRRRAARPRLSAPPAVLMALAGILWEREQYAAAEVALQRAADFCGAHDAWRLNMGHCLYMQVGGCGGGGWGGAGRSGAARKAVAGSLP